MVRTLVQVSTVYSSLGLEEPAFAMAHLMWWLYLGGQVDLLSGLIRGITGVTMWVIGVLNLLTESS